MVAGGVLAPFSGMMSLPLVAFGGSLVLGGVNSGINHAAMAIRGEGLNLVGMASDKIGGWYSVSLAKPAIASGNTLGQFFAGVGGAAGHMVSGIAQMNVVEITTGVSSLLSSRDARHQVASGLGEWWRQLSSGNAYVAGETAFNLASLVIGAGEVQTAFKVARGGEATSLLSKSGIFVKTLGKSGAKNVQHLATMPGRVGHSLSDLIKNPRIAFAGVGDSNSLLGRIKGGDALPKKTGVQTRFNGVMGEEVAKGVNKFKPLEIRLKNGELAYKAKDGTLVRSSKYLDDMGNINWPEAQGFLVDINGKAIMRNANLKKGQLLDRYGESGGTFTSPLENGNPLPFDNRGLPYPESMLSYHKYEVIKDINMKNVQQGFDNLSLVDQKNYTN